jgi:hypothetical protein
MRIRLALALLVVPIIGSAQPAPAPAPPSETSWRFAVAGDARNCGDVIMPAIAEGAKTNGARFYWHLGDWRNIYNFDEDMAQGAVMAGNPLQVFTYLRGAFKDALDNQLKAFDDRGVPVWVGIGNHETAYPMTRAAWVKAFTPYLDIAAIRDQRLKDDPSDTTVHTYYHIVTNGIDFITLDNASCDMFDDAQLAWLKKRLDGDAADASIHSIVAGMHAALPDSRSCGHSMGNYPIQQKSGREVYAMLLSMRDKARKKVYVLASHSHFLMDNVYDTDYWRTHGGVLPGWIVGTSGAQRYRLPETAIPGPMNRTDVYGYLIGTVTPNGAVTFEFHAITSNDIPPEVVKKYSKNFIDTFCFAANRNMTPQEGYCPPMSQCTVTP